LNEGLRRRRAARITGLLLLLALVPIGFLVLRDPRVKNWIKVRVPHPFDRSETLSERVAIRFFDLGRIGNEYRYDPVAYLLTRPNMSAVWEWPEHATGQLMMDTNDIGMREDNPIAELRPGPRVLVAGDSHTAGLVPNRESFANVAEALLRNEAGFEQVEVLNAGVAFTGPTCYLGVLKKYLELEPDAFVAVLFAGNDFADDIFLRFALDGWSMPRGSKEYHHRLRIGAEQFPEGIYQGFNQAYRWVHFQAEAERSVEIVTESFRQMGALCAEHGVAFLPVVLPTKMDVDGDDDAERQASLRNQLELSEEEVAVNLRSVQRVVQVLEAEGLRWLDPTEAMRDHAEPLYWRMDYHLNTAGHALVGRLLAEELRTLLARR